MTIDYLFIPAMLCKPKRVFFGVKNTFFENKALLTISTIKAIQYFKSRFYSGLFIKGDFNKTMYANINI